MRFRRSDFLIQMISNSSGFAFGDAIETTEISPGGGQYIAELGGL